MLVEGQFGASCCILLLGDSPAWGQDHPSRDTTVAQPEGGWEWVGFDTAEWQASDLEELAQNETYHFLVEKKCFSTTKMFQWKTLS